MTREGFIRFRGMRTWFRVTGDPGRRVPLLLVHGGPGIPSDPLETLEELADQGRAIVRYDQIGCGRSDRPRDPALWTVDTFLDELRTVRRELGLERVHLLGWSWGGMLAMQYALERPRGLESLVLASAPADAALWVTETRRLRDHLPPHVVSAMRRFEERYHPKPAKRSARVRRGMSTGRAQAIAAVARPMFAALATSPAVGLAAAASRIPFLRRASYDVVAIEFTTRHLIRRRAMDTPLCFFRSFAGMNRQVYETMWGPSEFLGTGNLRDWNVSARLGEIDVPTLITSGRYDEATPVQMRMLADRIPRSRWVLFEHSAHAALAEEPERYRAVLEGFLDRVEQSERSHAAPELIGSPDDGR
jgi:pimeloyl-ACP methyl ester carboxylesterase